MAVNNRLYNTLFGENEHADFLLDLLDLDRSDFGRYRDCFLNEDGTTIIVLTRCGGYNRSDYKIVFDHMKNHRWYNKDFDDPTDETYCYFVFEVPVIFYPQTKPKTTDKAVLTVGAKMEMEMEKIDKGDPEACARAKKIAEQMDMQIKAKPDGGIIFIGDPDFIKEESVK